MFARRSRRSLACALWRWAYPDEPDSQPSRFDPWEPLLEQMARMIGDRPVELGFVERRLPATIPLPQRRATTRSRYHVSDPYLRFYFRFMDPHLDLIEQKQTKLLWERIKEQFRAFIGMTTWEELCREWVREQAGQGAAPFAVELVGSHWSAGVQIDVAAVDWREKAILLGECKWGLSAVSRKTIRELADKASQVVPGDEWQVHYAYFARAGFTDAARAEAQRLGAVLVDLERLDDDLRRALLAASNR